MMLLNSDNGDAPLAAVLVSIDCAFAVGANNAVGRWLSRAGQTQTGRQVALAVLSGQHRLSACLAHPDLLDLLGDLEGGQREQLADEIISAVLRGRASHSGCISRLLHYFAEHPDGSAVVLESLVSPWFASAALRATSDVDVTVEDLWKLDPSGQWAVALLRQETVDLDVLARIAGRVEPASPVVDELPWKLPEGSETAKADYAAAVMGIVTARLSQADTGGFVALANGWNGTVGELLATVAMMSAEQPASQGDQPDQC